MSFTSSQFFYSFLKAFLELHRYSLRFQKKFAILRKRFYILKSQIEQISYFIF